jgi:hypothetical protein
MVDGGLPKLKAIRDEAKTPDKPKLKINGRKPAAKARPPARLKAKSLMSARRK